MPNVPNPRTLHDIAAQYGMSDEDFRRTEMYVNGLRDGSVEDPPATGPNIGTAVPDDVTAGNAAAEANFGIPPSTEQVADAKKVEQAAAKEKANPGRVTTVK